MNEKYIQISDLGKETAAQIVKNKQAWTDFLQTASWLTKYSFLQQMLIYAQCPTATACASLEVWNKKMNCWVKKGAKGIALISEDNTNQKLSYVFDIANVHLDQKLSRKLNLWELREEHHNMVMEYFEKKFGIPQNEGSYEEWIFKLAEKLAQDCYEELAQEMTYNIEESFLEELDEYSLKVRLRDTLRDSIGYILFSRFGLDASEYEESFGFEFIQDFNTMPILSCLGSSITKNCKDILMETGKCIFVADKGLTDKGVENSFDIRYNTLKRKSKNGIEVLNNLQQNENGHLIERGMEYGANISQGRGLFDTQHSGGRTAGGNIDKIRADEEIVFKKGAGSKVWLDADIGRTKKASAGGTRTGRADGRTNHEAVDGERRNYGAIEGGKPDALGTTHEQYSNGSRGNSKDGTDLHLNSGIKKPDSEILPGFLMPEIPNAVSCKKKVDESKSKNKGKQPKKGMSL